MNEEKNKRRRDRWKEKNNRTVSQLAITHQFTKFLAPVKRHLLLGKMAAEILLAALQR
jgi:hypothetical protein